MDSRLAVLIGLVALVGAINAAGYGYGNSYHTTKSYHQVHHSYTEKKWGEWGEWGSCSVTCGGGEQRRYRSCETKTIYGYGKDVDYCQGSTYRKRMCNTQCCPVDGNWGYWSSWSKTHGYGKETRSRYCNNPAPSCNGKYCYGPSTETRAVHYTPRPHYNTKSYHHQPSYHRPSSYHK